MPAAHIVLADGTFPRGGGGGAEMAQSPTYAPNPITKAEIWHNCAPWFFFPPRPPSPMTPMGELR